MADRSSADDILTQLAPYLEVARGAGSEILDEVGSELTQKAAGGITSLGLKTSGAIYRAVRNRFRRARAKANLDKDLASATNLTEREAAHRRFLSSDPHLRASLAALLERRDYLLALQAYCDDLPISGLVPGHFRLREVFIPPLLIPEVGPTRSQSSPNKVSYDRLLGEGSHLVIGDAGAGKSSLARWLTTKIIAELLAEQQAISLDELRLPVYVSAAELPRTNWAIALREAVERQLGIRGFSKLSDSFFDVHSPVGHRKWTVLIDGFDEIENQAQRQTILQSIADIDNLDPDAFQFIVFSREAGEILASRNFETWQIAPVASPDLLVDRYLSVDEQKAQAKELLGRPEYREVARNPFFVAMSAALIPQHSDLPNRPFAIVEAFIEYGVETAGLATKDKHDAIVDLLNEIAENSEIRVSDLVARCPSASAKLSQAAARLSIERDIDQALLATGLVKHGPEGSYRFLHRLIDRHFLARSRASQEAPDSSVWTRLDPMRLGWTAVEQLCAIWSEAGADAGAAIEALADFGPAAHDVMLRLSIYLPQIEDKVFKRPFDALFVELENGELTHAHDQMLPRLAAQRDGVRRRLLGVVRNSWYGFDLAPAANALANAGHFCQIRDRLIDVVFDDEGDPYSQNEVASILLQHGHQREALSTFSRLAETAPDDWERLDAACRYCRADPSDEARERVRQIINEDFVEGDSQISPWLMEDVLDLGLDDLAIPLLREAATTPRSLPPSHWMQFDQAIRAAAALGKHDVNEGIIALESLLTVPGISLREQAEVLARIGRLKPSADIGSQLETFINNAPAQVDWRVIEMLIETGREPVAWKTAKQFVRPQLGYGQFNYDARQIFERAVCFAPREDAERFILQGLQRHPIPELAAMLSQIGRADLARAHLLGLLDDADPRVGVRACLELTKSGMRSIARGWLVRLARNRNIDPEIRLSAATELANVADASLAMIAIRKIVRDPRLSIADRCDAAVAYSRLSFGEDELIIRILENCVSSLGNSSADKLLALKTALKIDSQAYFFWQDPEAGFWEIIEDGEIGKSELQTVCELAGRLGIEIESITQVKEAFEDNGIEPLVKLDSVEAIRSREDLPSFAKEALAKIALDSRAKWRDRCKASEALEPNLPPDVSLHIETIVSDPLVPPKWRLEIAKGGWNGKGNPARQRWLEAISNDDSVDIRFRLEAFDTASRFDDNNTFPDFRSLRDLSIFECVQIADAALRRNCDAISGKYLKAGMRSEPKSIAELVALFELARKLRSDCENELLHRISEVPLQVMVHTEDTSSVRDAIAAIGTTDPDLALSRLTSLVISDKISIWSVPDIIDQMTNFVAEDRTLEIVRPVLNSLVDNVLRDPHERHHVVTALEPLYERNWLTDIEPLFEYARDPQRRLIDRIGAAAFVLRAGIGSKDAARALLSELLDFEPMKVGDAIFAASQLLRSGFWADALHMSRKAQNSDEITSAQRLMLAGVMSDLGRQHDAESVMTGISFDELGKCFLSDNDKVRLRAHFGDELVAEFLVKRFDNTDELPEKLLEARDRVNDDGDASSFQFIYNLATNTSAPAEDRLEAIDNLEQLGFRTLSRNLFDSLDLEVVDPLWVAMQSDRFGYKDRALSFYRQAMDKTHNDNAGTLLAGLADLGAVEDIERVLAMSR